MLDGVFFLGVTEEPIFDELPFERLEIKTCAATLEDSLLGFLRSGDQERLRGYAFSSLPVDRADDEAERIRILLKDYRSTGIDHWRKIRKVLVDIGFDRTAAERLESAWARWIELATSGRVAVSPWQAKFPFNHELEKRLSGSRPEIHKSLITELGLDAERRVWHERNYRSTITGILKEAYTGANIEEEADLATIYSWFNAAYNNTAAAQHDCGSVEVTELPGSRPVGGDQILYDWINERLESGPSEAIAELTANVPSSFSAALGRLPKATIDRLLADHKNNLVEWYDENDISRLRRVVDELVESVDRIEKFEVASLVPPWVSPRLRTIMKGAGGKMGAGAGGAIGGAIGVTSGELLLSTLLGIVVGSLVSGEIDKAADKVLGKVEKRKQAARCIIERAQSIRKIESQ